MSVFRFRMAHVYSIQNVDFRYYALFTHNLFYFMFSEENVKSCVGYVNFRKQVLMNVHVIIFVGFFDCVTCVNLIVLFMNVF